MGNNASSEGATLQKPVRPLPFSRNGALGLSKAELEKRCQPSGLYPSCKWEEKAIRRLIADGRLAARLRGTESRVSPFDRECPICFLHYSQVNVTQCCRAHVCTECYLQVRPQKERNSACPFCNNSRLQVAVAQKMGIDDIQEREEEEQRVIAATIRSRVQEGPESGVASSEGSESSVSTFGSSLQQIMRARSESLGEISEHTDSEQLASLALTPDERRALEEEMRAQHSHPLARRVEAEAEERRIQNEREYYRTHSGNIRERYSEFSRFGLGSALSGAPTDVAHRGFASRLDADSTLQSGLAAMPPGPRRARDWNRIVDAFESGGHGEVQSLDDLVVLEAAILLSMEEESRRNQLEGRTGVTSFDAASHAREGFPLVQEFLNARGATDDDDEDALQTSVRSVGRPVRRRSSLLQGRLRRLSASTGSSRSMTEDEQIALAIAASLREFGTPTSSTDSGDQVGEEGDAAAAAGGKRVFLGSAVAVGIATQENRPAVGIMVADGDAAGPAVGIMVDDETVDKPAIGVMVEESPVRRLAVGVMAEDDPTASPADDKSERSTPTEADRQTEEAPNVEGGPVSTRGVRSITCGDAVVSTGDDDDVGGSRVDVDTNIGESPMPALDDDDDEEPETSAEPIAPANSTETSKVDSEAITEKCEVVGEGSSSTDVDSPAT